MKTLTQIKKEIVEEKEKYFKNYIFWCKKIKKKAREILGEDVRVLVFGSIVKGNWGPNSDIDVLIISKKLKNNLEESLHIKTEIKKKIGPFSPFQIHLANLEEYKDWYKKFIKKNYKEI